MDFQPPYFPPPFPGTASVQPAGQDVFSQHLQAADPYQQYAVRRYDAFLSFHFYPILSFLYPFFGLGLIFIQTFFGNTELCFYLIMSQS